MSSSVIIDSHCHLADPRLADHVGEVIARSIAHGISVFIQGGVGPEDWAALAKLEASLGQFLRSLLSSRK